MTSLNDAVHVHFTCVSVSYRRLPLSVFHFTVCLTPHFSMADKPPTEGILEQLRLGIAKFELVSSPVASISNPNSQTCPTAFHRDSNHLFFARIGPPLGGGSPVMKKVERYLVQRVTGDGRCLFRALVKGMALNKGINLNSREEREDADDLRMAVKEVICDSGSERRQYEEALISITIDESLKRYCQRIGRSDFWGGESELLHRGGGGGSGFIPIAEYGAEFRRGSRNGKPRKVVRLLYSGRNHYDLLF
ncbi:OVARIAN TUMOR DOMAIN-containing deubiquitinating enzyme 3 [Citrus sinensis]|uniref:OVARIAN TUMOR DOMAIN-containing deubiquitinating enzyme 3 n=1 Tax=Citrus sinensis TaxID=2711 RepID=A0ACB8JV42_CITSI|nr:OVARIAN TUMOR DOMAIN-containing deubiquitinating enzyme 3 [Citrus sinensis]